MWKKLHVFFYCRNWIHLYHQADLRVLIARFTVNNLQTFVVCCPRQSKASRCKSFILQFSIEVRCITVMRYDWECIPRSFLGDFRFTELCLKTNVPVFFGKSKLGSSMNVWQTFCPGAILQLTVRMLRELLSASFMGGAALHIPFIEMNTAVTCATLIIKFMLLISYITIQLVGEQVPLWGTSSQILAHIHLAIKHEFLCGIFSFSKINIKVLKSVILCFTGLRDH